MSAMTWELLSRMLVAVAIGAAIGVERESRDKAAGFRTMTLISLGSALFTIFSIRIGAEDNNSARIAAQIVTGVGFLGAGAIMREGPRVSGLTTAATIWLVASLGMGAGAGDWQISVAATGIVLAVLVAFPYLEWVIDTRRETESYVVICDIEAVDRLQALVSSSGLHHMRHTIGRDDQVVTLTWTLIGRHEYHHRLAATLFEHPDVRSLA